jgi:hypothetical protein
MTAGFPDGTYRPTTTISRQEITAIFYRATAAFPSGDA